MTLNLLSLATVKAELGIDNTDSDTAIEAMIPRVSADVRRILNFNYDVYVPAVFDETSTSIDMGETGNFPWLQVPTSILPMGQVLYSPNLKDDTYIIGFNPSTLLYTLSSLPDDSGEYVYPTVNIAMWSAISKMIWYRIQGLTSDDVADKAIASESYGPVSLTYTESEINKQWNYPQVLIDDLGIPYSEVG